MVYIPELGGHVASHNEDMATNKPDIFLSGDLSGIEEASTAMLEGKIAGASAFESLKGVNGKSKRIKEQAKAKLCMIRQGPFGEKAKCGKEKLSAVTRWA
jgi:sarcosine oxidase subunit alpha